MFSQRWQKSELREWSESTLGGVYFWKSKKKSWPPFFSALGAEIVSCLFYSRLFRRLRRKIFGAPLRRFRWRKFFSAPLSNTPSPLTHFLNKKPTSNTILFGKILSKMHFTSSNYLECKFKSKLDNFWVKPAKAKPTGHFYGKIIYELSIKFFIIQIFWKSRNYKKSLLMGIVQSFDGYQ